MTYIVFLCSFDRCIFFTFNFGVSLHAVPLWNMISQHVRFQLVPACSVQWITGYVLLLRFRQKEHPVKLGGLGREAEEPLNMGIHYCTCKSSKTTLCSHYFAGTIVQVGKTYHKSWKSAMKIHCKAHMPPERKCQLIKEATYGQAITSFEHICGEEFQKVKKNN